LEKALKEKDYDLERLIVLNRRLEDDIRHLNDKMGEQDKSY